LEDRLGDPMQHRFWVGHQDCHFGQDGFSPMHVSMRRNFRVIGYTEVILLNACEVTF
jgi:hypothetical protein